MGEIGDYFSLDCFAHRNLWKEGLPVWTPLQMLDDYFKTWDFQIEIEIPPNIYLDRPELISIGQGTVIEPGVYIQGPCIIGRDCTLRHGAYLRQNVICGDRSAIGHGAEIKHSILLDDVAVTHFNYIGDSIVGNQANLGAGVKCSNLRLDRDEISVFLYGKQIKTGLRKFGAIIGDHAQIGCNCVLNPGTLVGRECIAYPLLNFGGQIPMRSNSRFEGKNSCSLMGIEENLKKNSFWLLSDLEKKIDFAMHVNTPSFAAERGSGL
jgi:UDP-N-acetylglucosamine diphosphorylase / glucose-1-phosphate thymidylyltransferase / UDP-N-acetylgalactosamine diphosphorylase / glucosamine-1-phosphate N-acetyltransferase / galactosamine-1-phosphate N-acetyltransferase